MSTIELVSPFPTQSLQLAWSWLNEFPERNFDDYGPKTPSQFGVHMVEREEAGERTWLVKKDGAPVGIVGYQPVTPRMGWFHGICFTRAAWGRETTQAAVGRVINELFASGVEKIGAAYYADNPRIGRFLEHLGAVDEGLLRAHTLRGGQPVDMRLVAIFPETLTH